MERETNQANPSLLSIGNSIKEECSPKKPLAGGGGVGACGGGDRLKRDEWSEGAVSSLLEAYEKKWVLRNRAKLKGQDWEDVARYVSSRANCTKLPKTQTQCKNKIESMKKRYRSESATADGSSWPLFSRLDLLLRGSASPTPTPAPAPLPPPPPPTNTALLLPESSPPPLASPLPPPAPPPPLVNSPESNGVQLAAKDDGVGTKLSDHASDKMSVETDSSTPNLYTDKENLNNSKKTKLKMEKKKGRKRQEWEISESIRWLAQVVVRSEQARMDTMRELEKMRVEAENKRGEIDLKRTEIIANTQLEIARLFAGAGKGVDSSLRIGRN